jgi:hypothetical protein
VVEWFADSCDQSIPRELARPGYHISSAIIQQADQDGLGQWHYIASNELGIAFRDVLAKLR